jgi:serine O-acetyltransferase
MFDRMREDIRCVLDRDPAAHSAIEVMLLYPGFKAVRSHRKAHWFYNRKMFFIARMIFLKIQKSNKDVGMRFKNVDRRL